MPRTELLIHIRPEGCIWINTDVRGFYLTYFMTLFLIDLDKMEHTCTCLNIIEIKPNFRSLFYHDSIIKIFCSREQSASRVHAHTFIDLKKNKRYKIVRFWQGFEKRFMASPREFALVFFWFLCSLVSTIFSACSIIQ